MEKNYDCVIIGAGPAGLTAAVYLARARLKCLVVGKWKFGNLYKAHIVGNYPGFSKDVTGAYLIEEMVKQGKRFGAEYLGDEVISLTKENNFIFQTDTKKVFSSKTVIIALGKAYRMSNVKNEKELTGRGVSYCVTCDGLFFKDKKIAVIGSRNLAAAESLELLRYTKDITIFTNGRDPEITDTLMKELKKSKIKIRKEKVAEFIGNKKLESLVFENKKSENFDGVFIALGTTSAMTFANRLGLEMEDTNIKVDREFRTSLEGIWAAGDCVGSNAQAVVSAGNGCDAAISIIKSLKGKRVYIDYD